jgi:hypothetical protein
MPQVLLRASGMPASANARLQAHSNPPGHVRGGRDRAASGRPTERKGQEKGGWRHRVRPAFDLCLWLSCACDFMCIFVPHYASSKNPSQNCAAGQGALDEQSLLNPRHAAFLWLQESPPLVNAHLLYRRCALRWQSRPSRCSLRTAF